MSRRFRRLPRPHGETEWTVSGHTPDDRSPLTERGERTPELGSGCGFLRRVFTSPLQRASRTCELAGFGRRESIATSSNGTTASTKGGAPRRFTKIGRTGSCSATAAPAANRRRRSAREPTRRRPRPRDRRQCAAVLERALPARPRRPLARARAGGRTVLPAEHGQPQRARLRAQPVEPVIRLWDDTRHVDA